MSADGVLRVPSGKLWPNFEKEYSYTPEHIEKAAAKVARLYSFFLKREAHEGKAIEHLRKEKKLGKYDHRPTEFASHDKVAEFKELLKEKIVTSLSEKKSIYLGPGSYNNILHYLMREAGIENGCYYWHYPIGTLTRLNVYDNGKVYISLEVRLNNEKKIDVLREG